MRSEKADVRPACELNFNRQGFYANNVLLRSRISAMSYQSSTAVCGVVHYIETEAPELQLIECAL